MKTILQTICVVTVAVGIGIEIYYGAHIGFVSISIGSLAFGVSTKIEGMKK